MPMLTVYSDAHNHHQGRGELFGGGFHPCVERPERATTVLAHLQEADLGPIVTADRWPLSALYRVHDPAYIAFLQTAYADWQRKYPGDSGDALPYTFALERASQPPRDIEGRLGYYASDVSTPIMGGTWPSARAAAEVALTAQQHVQEGVQTVFALCRPPGHHASHDRYGGYCFLNNAAIATRALIAAGAKVAILDVDYHHGNGTQALFWTDANPLFVSLHVDPTADFPYFSGTAAERGAEAGEGATYNLPLLPGTGWARYARALDEALTVITDAVPDVLLVSLGLDTAANDPIATFRLRDDDYHHLGAHLARFDGPTLFVLEGGYALSSLGTYVTDVFLGFLSNRSR